MVKYGFAVDLSRCLGCRSCVVACKVENNTPKAAFWMHVFRWEEGEFPHVQTGFLPRPCMHCDRAPCVRVCPVGARFKREDGFVLTDFERCIGCRMCQSSCPYSVNVFNWKHPDDRQYYDWKGREGDGTYGTGSAVDRVGEENIPPYRNPDLEQKYGDRLVAGSGHYVGVMEKCTWCVHRVEKGLKPACVANCPGHVLHFGDLDDQNSEISNLLAKKPHFRLLEEIGTEPNVFYLGRPPPDEDVRLIETVLRGIELPSSKKLSTKVKERIRNVVKL